MGPVDVEVKIQFIFTIADMMISYEDATVQVSSVETLQ